MSVFPWLDVERTTPDTKRPHFVRQWCLDHGEYSLTRTDPELQRQARLSHDRCEHSEAGLLDGPEFIDAFD